jgi:hypothetical protein
MMALEIANQFWWKVLPDEDGPTFFLFVRPQHLLYGLLLAHGRVLFSVLLWPTFALATSKAMFGERASPIAALKACLARARSCCGLAAANWSLQFLLPEVLIGGLLVGTVFLVFEVFKANPDDPLHLGPLSVPVSLALGWMALQWIRASIAMSAPAWAIEDLGVRASIRRARRLSKGGRLRVFVACLAPATLGWVATLTVSRALFYLWSSCPLEGPFLIYRLRVFAALIPWHGWCVSTSVVEAIRILSEAAILTLIGPIFPIALTLFYFDQRIRREGFDIECMMDAAGMADAPDVMGSTEEAPA